MAEFIPLISEEEGNDTAWYVAGAAGIGSGLFKVPEGIFSLAAELIDLGLDTNLAGKVEQAFDFINPFDELAQQHGAGKLTEALVSIGVPSTIGFTSACHRGFLIPSLFTIGTCIFKFFTCHS